MLFILFVYINYLIIIDVLSMGEKAHLYEEDMIGRIAFNFEIISYKILLDLLYISPRLSRDIASPNFTSI
jgi:hypothetical protein